MGGAAGIRAMDLFSTTYFDENIIFVLSKGQTFRIRCTLVDPAQFLFLVLHLFLAFFITTNKINSILSFQELSFKELFQEVFKNYA